MTRLPARNPRNRALQAGEAARIAHLPTMEGVRHRRETEVF
jgi:hypothetical protein